MKQGREKHEDKVEKIIQEGWKVKWKGRQRRENREGSKGRKVKGEGRRGGRETGMRGDGGR